MNTQQANPAGEPSQGFRERALARINSERGAEPRPTSAQPVDARQSVPAEAPKPARSLQEEDNRPRQSPVESDAGVDPESVPEGEAFEDDDAYLDDEGEVSEPEEGSADYWKLKATEAEEARRSMEKDYRRKTHKIAETVRNLESTHEEALSAAHFFAGMADQGVKQFESVNWQMLQQDPERYMQAKQAFVQAQQYQTQMKEALEKVRSQAQEHREKAKRSEAQVSREVLPAVIPNWGNEMYASLRDFAVQELDYSSQEFNEITDWRRMRDIYAQYSVSQAATKVGKPTQRTKPEKRTGNPSRPVVRNDRGQFQSARNEFRNRPGDRSAAQNFFLRKLQAERRNPR